jgi:hypothetical protein
MNLSTSRHLATTALMLGATLAAAFSATQAQAADRTVRVATLPTVEIVARREVVLAPRVAQLPRVTVTGKRTLAEAPTRLAQKPAAAAPRS